MRWARILGIGFAATACLVAFAFVPSAWGADGPFYGWGDGGALGDGTDGPQSSPEAIDLAPGVTPVALSVSDSGLAIGSNGKLYGWGTYPGDGGINVDTPSVVTLGAGVTPIAISAGLYNNLAIGSDHKLYSWGAGQDTGNGTEGPEVLTPQVISLAPGVTPTAISAGGDFSLAIGSDGYVYGWGANGAVSGYADSPQLIEIERGTPEHPTLEPFAATAISAGADHSLAIGSDGQLYAWGIDDEGQLGTGKPIGSTEAHPTLVTLGSGLTPSAIGAGWWGSAAIGSDGNLYSWGYYGMVGDGTEEARVSPERITLAPGVSPTQLAAGNVFEMALGSNGTIYQWGQALPNEGAQLSPTPLAFPSGVTPVAITAGGRSGLAITTGGPAAGGTVKLKTTKLIGNIEDKISGSGWTHDTKVGFYECSTPYYTTSSCSKPEPKTEQSLTNHAFEKHVVKITVGSVGYHENPCGVAGGVTCYVVVVGNTEDETSSGPLSFKLPIASVKLTEEVPSGYLEKVKASNFPEGQTVEARECDSNADESNLDADCASEGITATAGKGGKPKFTKGVKILTGSEYKESGNGKCEPGETCTIAVYDPNTPSTAVIVPFRLAS